MPRGPSSMSKDLSEESNVSFTLSISLVDKMCVENSVPQGFILCLLQV